MSWRRRVARIGALLHRKRLVDDLDEEIRAHIEMEERENLEAGMPPDEAHFAALRRFGNVTQTREKSREMWNWQWLETLLQDLRYGLRQLRRNPGFTAVAVLTLALGIGANTAIFSVVNAVILRPLPYPQPERLVLVYSTQTPGQRGREASYPDFLDWRTRNHVFKNMAVFRTGNFTLISDAGPEHLSAAIVSSSLLHLLGVAPVLGRSFLPGDDEPGAVNGANAVILSYGFWQRRFGSRPQVVGKSINLDGHLFSVVGVAPPGFQFPGRSEAVDLWTTIAVDKDGAASRMATMRGAHYLDTVARLTPEVTIPRAQAEMSAIVSGMNKEHPDIHPRGVRIVPLLDGLVGPARMALLILLGAVGCVLLIACANVANLLLARATARQREMSIRNALGASRGRVVRQVLTESTLLSLLGGSLGLWLGLRGMDLLVRITPVDIPRLLQTGLDNRVLIFTAVVSLVTGLLFGLAPAIIGFRSDLAGSLKESGRGPSQGSHRTRTHGALVVGEIALALVLLACAGLLIQSFLGLEKADPGFDPHDILTLRLDSPSAYSIAQQLNFFARVIDGARSLPGVRSASGVFGLAFSEINANTGFDIEGRKFARSDRPEANFVAVAPDYFRTLGMPRLEGRDFTERDNLQAVPVAIVNAALARRYFPGQNLIGQRIKPGISSGYGDRNPVREIVGVVGDVKVTNLAAGPEPQCYVPLAQSPLGVMTLVVRSDGDPLEMAPAVRRLVASTNKQVPVYNVRSLDQMLAQSVAQPRFITFLFGMFAALAVALAAIGLYGVISYSVSQRTHEIGIRMAIGAEKNDVLKFVVGRGLKLALSGVAVGIAGALALTRFLASILYGVTPTDPLTFVAVSLVLLAVALLACYIPARRAAKVDPMVALRYE
jgi:putative ABC transport system permease protein